MSAEDVTVELVQGQADSFRKRYGAEFVMYIPAMVGAAGLEPATR
jgi:hypothetical protein